MADQPSLFQATGDRGQAFKLTNRGMNDCYLDGYPQAIMKDHVSTTVSFHYTDGQSEYVTHRPPQRVTLGSGRSAYFGVAKQACGLPTTDTATTLSVLVPGQHVPIAIELTTEAGVAPTFQYCGSDPSDPDNLVALSPIEATLDAVQE